MAISEYEKLQDKVSSIDSEDEFYFNICQNLKKFRLEKYNEFKSSDHGHDLNPYSSENMSALLGYSHTHYKRFESANDSTKKIPLSKLAKIAVILDRPIDDFIKKQ